MKKKIFKNAKSGRKCKGPKTHRIEYSSRFESLHAPVFTFRNDLVGDAIDTRRGFLQKYSIGKSKYTQMLFRPTIQNIPDDFDL